MPKIYINYFSKNRDIIKILVRELINGGRLFKKIISEILGEDKRLTPSNIEKLINGWIKNGEIKEENQFNLLMNIISLSLFSFIGKQIVETVLNVSIEEDEKFYKERVKSISNL